MELKIWCKTFLNVYKCLEKITQAIDKIVLTTGLNLMSDTGYSANKILELTNRKITLINLKLFIEKLLNELPEECTKLLILKYVDGVKTEDIAQIFGISNRTFFRKNLLALKSFELALKRNGKSSESLLEEYKKETWIIDLYQRLYSLEISFLKEKNKAEENKINKNQIIDFAYENYKKTSVPNFI